MRFRILGPFEIQLADDTVRMGRSRQERTLAALLLDANRVVPVERLIDVCWDSEPPRTARKLVQNAVSALRQQLADHADIVASPSGYLLRVADGQLDLAVFEQATTRARQAMAAGESGDAVDEFRAALALWRGPALAGITGRVFEARAAGLDETRLAAIEECLAQELALGRHHEVVGELSAVVADHPLRERLVGLLMLALHRSGRRADALVAFGQVRARLAEELGIDPGAELCGLHEAVLRGDSPVPVRPAVAQVLAPAQLPADVAEFTGRGEYLEQLDRFAQRGVVTAISGTAGVGKTALAVHWAHRVRERFDDGQLYVNLRGYAPTAPMPPAAALAGFLRALGVSAEQVPVELEEASALYRTLLADKRVLVVLDNARGVEQVRPLLPGGTGCLVLVTSRDRLAGLVARDSARRVALDVLPVAEATALLVQVLGAERASAELAAVVELARLCSYLPLALRIAAANLLCHPHLTVADHVAELSAGNRLGALAVDGDEDSAVRAAFDLSYAAQPEEARRLFRLLGLVPGPDFTPEAAAALACIAPGEASSLLDRLTGACLIEAHARGRYTIHDLLRLYAAERAQVEESAEDREAATARLFDWYLLATDAAAHTFNPHYLRLPLPSAAGRPPKFRDDAHALAWLDSEWPGLHAAVAHAAEHGPRPVAWLLTDRLYSYCFVRMRCLEWQDMANAGLAAARAEGNLIAQASSLLSLADAYSSQSRYQLAIDHLTHGLDLARLGGWRDGEPMILSRLGSALWSTGQPGAAAEHYRMAIELARRVGRRRDEAVNLGNLGGVCHDWGELELAVDHYTQALAIYPVLGSRLGEAINRANLGEVLHALGRLDEAVELLVASMTTLQELGDRRTEPEARRMLAAVYRDAGRHSEALQHARTALLLARETGDRRTEAAALCTLGATHDALGDHQLALASHEQARNLARERDDRYPELAAIIGMAMAHVGLGQPELAQPLAEHAAEHARLAGYRVLDGQANTVLAAVRLAMDRPKDAIEDAEAAIAIHHTTGHRLGEARTWQILAEAHAQADTPEAAASARTQADALLAQIGAAEPALGSALRDLG